MIYSQDWILRQIEMMAQFVARAMFKKDSTQYEILDESNMSQTDLLYVELNKLLKENRICDAEDLLFDNLNNSNDFLNLAIDFYSKLNLLSDKELDDCDFSRQEIKDGIDEIVRHFGIPL